MPHSRSLLIIYFIYNGVPMLISISQFILLPPFMEVVRKILLWYCFLFFSCRCCCQVTSVVSYSSRPHRWSSPPGSAVHGIFQARVLEWVAIVLQLVLANSHSKSSDQRILWLDESRINAGFILNKTLKQNEWCIIHSTPY